MAKKKIQINIPKFKFSWKSIIMISLLVFVVSLSFWSRLGTMKLETILDYDPWWHYRYAKMIIENNYLPPRWDLLSFFPPGRPIERSLGWDYTIAFFYAIASIFSKISLMTVAKIAPVIMVGLGAITAYVLGKQLSNKWGGLATAIFATLTPTFIGVSMAGYSDTDAVVVFYSFFCIYSFFYAMKKRNLFSMIFAIFINFMFIWNWGAGWYVPFFFLALLPVFFVFRIIEKIVHERKSKIDLNEIINELKPFLKPTIIILVILNLIGVSLQMGNVVNFFLGGLGFISASDAIVNVSVAELQPVKIFTKDGFLSVAQRVGMAPFLFMIIGLPILVFYKIVKKKSIKIEEVFLFMWSAGTFYLILSGVRFSLLFSVAVATAAGYVIGNLTTFFKESKIIRSTIFGAILFSIFIFVSDSLLVAKGASGMEVGQNWIDMLDWLKENADPEATVATWWDPGHIITGYTGLRVNADGAHCTDVGCYPYPHNTRIQDMGRIMSTSDEDEAVALLEKYMNITDEDCKVVKEKFGEKNVPEDACEPASETYFISSSDLIGKFTWMNYFGGFRAPITSQQDFEKNPGVCCPSTPPTEPGQMSCGEFADQGRGVWVWCPWMFNFVGQQQDQEGNPVYVYDYSGLKVAIIQKGDQLIPIYNNKFVINNMVFFDQGQEQKINLTNSSIGLEGIDGLIWVDPSFRTLIYFSPSIKDSVFTKSFFFNGEGLEHFEQVYINPEIRLYKVNFD